MAIDRCLIVSAFEVFVPTRIARDFAAAAPVGYFVEKALCYMSWIKPKAEITSRTRTTTLTAICR